MEIHYNQKTIKDALQKIGVNKGDTIFSHSNVGFFGRPEGAFNERNIFNTIKNAIFEVIGDSGTLIVPTFTYSFCNNKLFDIENSKSNCGFFAEMVRKSPDSYRSCDPLISVAAIGKLAKYFTQNAPENSYGDDSFFDRFFNSNGKICNFNFDAGSTFVHYVERKLKVPYRFDKTFNGEIKEGNKLKNKQATIFVRHLKDGTEARFEAFDSLASDKKLYKKEKVGRGFIGCIESKAVMDLISETISNNSLFLTKAGIKNSKV